MRHEILINHIFEDMCVWFGELDETIYKQLIE